MNILIVLTTLVGVIHCHLTLLKTDENVSIDPYQDSYIQTIFRMSKKDLMQLPKIDDDTFLFNLERGIDNMTSLSIVKNSMVFDDRLDEELLSQRGIEEKWEDLVVAGPITVNYLSNLMVIASKQDFALIPPTPNYIYEYIKYPNSFRTTLVQLGNEMYSAFLGAHTNMDRIQMNMQQIPNHIKTALKLLTSASPRLIKTLLPLTLTNIKRIASQCMQSANSTTHNYRNLAAFLHELTAVAQGTGASSSSELIIIGQLLANSTAEQDLLNVQIESIRQEFEAAREALQKAQKEYYEAYHAIPGRRKRFFGGFVASTLGSIVGSVVNVFSGALQTVGCIFASCGGRPIDNTPFENAKKKAELALERLKQAQAIYDKWYTQMLEKQDKLTATIIQLSQLNMTNIDHQTIINILTSASQEIIHIQTQWDKMIRFFAKLSLQAEQTQGTILFEFIGVIEETEMASGVLDDADREFYVTLLLGTADEIDRGAHLLYIMSKTYYDISHQYIMTQIAGISQFLLPQTDTERENRMKQIAQETLSTSAKVSRMALERRQQYDQRNEERRIAYEQFIQQVALEDLQSSIGK